MPALFAIAMGILVGAVERTEDLLSPLALVGSVFVLLQVLTPMHQAVSATQRAELLTSWVCAAAY